MIHFQDCYIESIVIGQGVDVDVRFVGTRIVAFTLLGEDNDEETGGEQE